jgi:hypothetical protein
MQVDKQEHTTFCHNTSHVKIYHANLTHESTRTKKTGLPPASATWIPELKLYNNRFDSDSLKQ